MSGSIAREGLAPGFWARKALDDFNKQEWEALCDGCGKCCLNKLEDDDGTVELTRVACRLLDNESCLCAKYPIRHSYVPECIVLTPKTVEQHMYWLPKTCAYRLVYEGKDLEPWHPLKSGDQNSVHDAGMSMIGRTVSEAEVDDDDWEDHIIEEPR